MRYTNCVLLLPNAWTDCASLRADLQSGGHRLPADGTVGAEGDCR